MGQVLPDVPPEGTIPEVTEEDELETFVGAKKQSLDLDSRESFSSRHLSLGN